MVQKPLFIPEKCENLLINEHKFKVGLSLSAGNKMKTIIPQTWDKIFEICLNGAAARKVCIGDLVIIVAYASMKHKKAKNFSPTVVHVNEKNEINE
ncbi:aspartate 1-decarboxylase [Campylobacter fetus]|uniref:aspartate 1-decarboxylase n=1 Tax=Campylobacter fetus TaxID=196 RepID=UPI001F0835DD|nr:aspartate 1-decarboxylase [Campylobacter fetus]